MANRDDLPCQRRDARDEDPDRTDSEQVSSETGDGAVAARVSIVWADLTRADYEALWQQSNAFKELARELRAIVRGCHPDVR